jgi:outer membrane protein assembly factor BamD (BamD/ComL family)
MRQQTSWCIALTLAVIWCGAGCATWGGTAAAAKPGEMPHFASKKERENWWKSKKHAASFEPGKGYSLPDVPGYFDAKGNSMQPESVHQASFESAPVVADAEATAVSSSSWLDNLDPITAYNKTKKSFSVQPDGDAAKQRFKEAEALFAEKKYAAAQVKYGEVIELAPDTVWEEDSMFMQAESYFFADKYVESSDSFDELIKKYPSSRYIDKAIARQFGIARYWQLHHKAEPHWSMTPNFTNKSRPWFDTYGHSMRVYENIRLNDPTGPLADDAIMSMANAHFLAGRYEDADYNYSLLRKEYPESEFQFEAHLLGLQCKLRRYQGPDYDGSPLVEADKIAEQLLKQFPDQIQSERARIESIRLQLAREHALRDYSMATYYEKTKYYGAAKFYYREVAEKFPTTQLAEKSRTRLAELEGEQDIPDQTAEWFVKLFPDSKKSGLYTAKPISDTVIRR